MEHIATLSLVDLILCNSIVLITMDRLFDITNQDEPSTGATLEMAEADEGTYSYHCCLIYFVNIAVKSS